LQALEKPLRVNLERAIKKARAAAEKAARAALEQLGVGEASPLAYLSENERKLRRRLRTHGRQLGDALNGGNLQTMEHLVEETAYEHWHRMLFARFLAANHLLMDPDPDDPVAVTLEECEELAADEGAANGWELAARFAARMLPQIFRPDSPVFQIGLPPEHQQKLERLVAELPQEVFTASDSLGWVYQFWQAKKKEEVNASEVKIGARELPAVTQLFTEPYMVHFLLDNSLGAWWAARQLSETHCQIAKNEEELRHKAALPGVPLAYLRFVQREDGTWEPAAGAFDDWPENLREFKTLDPCCGSGHFLVAAFLMLVPMRMSLEGLCAREAVDRVLAENIHGLELDSRCVSLAAFALALAAWRYPDENGNAIGYRPLPELHVACSGLSVSVAKEEWKQLAKDKRNFAMAMDWLYDTFHDAPVLGSLLDPGKSDAAKLVPWRELQTHLAEALEGEPSDARQEAGVVAQGLAKAAQLLGQRYTWVLTNVPYLARGKQNKILREFCECHYPAAKNDLATVFLERCLQLCEMGGTASVVLPQNWLFLNSYRKFREQLLKRDQWHLIARLGPGAFETISGEVVKAILLTISRGNINSPGGLFGEAALNRLIRGLDVSEPRTAAEKAVELLTVEVKSVVQAKQLENPDARVVFDNFSLASWLSDVADYGKGSTTGDSLQFLLFFWEFTRIDKRYVLWLNSPIGGALWSGRSQVCTEPIASEKLKTQLGCWLRGNSVWGRRGVVVSKMRKLEPFLYTGEIFDDNICPICPKDESIIPAIWTYVESGEYHEKVRTVDQKLNVTAATLTKVPFDLDHWTKIAQEKYPNGLPQPYSNDPTQWLFHGHPCGRVQSSVLSVQQEKTDNCTLTTDNFVLQIAVARLLGYRWPAELDNDMELADEARGWVKKSETLLPYADEDGIVCIPPVRGEASAEDQLLRLLIAAYGDAWTRNVLSQLLTQVDHAGKTLESWLRDKFFTQHCKLFHHRPFIWHIWDGLGDGFAALVNYHKLDAKLLETLTYTYLGDWISRQQQDIANSVDGAQEKLAAAEQLKKKLELILEGEAPYDIFVRWKPIEQQPIGWAPDLNDGVRLNIRPFLSVPDVGKKGAGVLRDKPNIKWDKDRGKDVASAPWYHLWHGDRINDHHLSLAEKISVQSSVLSVQQEKTEC